MERNAALLQLRALVGADLVSLASKNNIRIRTPEGQKNKGWAGHTCERILGLPLNSSRSPNFGSWELKQVSLKRKRDGVLSVKETMAITMIDPVEVVSKDFRESHLFAKLNKQIVLARIWESAAEERSLIHSVSTFDLDNPMVLAAVERDYEAIRDVLRGSGDVASLTGWMGVLVQPRTKGPGGAAPRSRAFYARTQFVAHIIDINPLNLGTVEGT